MKYDFFSRYGICGYSFQPMLSTYWIYACDTTDDRLYFTTYLHWLGVHDWWKLCLSWVSEACIKTMSIQVIACNWRLKYLHNVKTKLVSSLLNIIWQNIILNKTTNFNFQFTYLSWSPSTPGHWPRWSSTIHFLFIWIAFECHSSSVGSASKLL